MHRPIGSSGTLEITGQFFTYNGQPFTAIESSDFSLFKRDLDGEDIRPIRQQRRDLGFNGERVWLLNDSVVGYRNGYPQAGIHPDQYPDFYERLRRFVGEGPEFCDLTVFTQTPLLMPMRDDQQRHLDRSSDAVRGLGNVIMSVVNENDHRTDGALDNIVSPNLVRPTGALITRGSNNADSLPPHHDDPWDAEEYHSNDLDQWQRKVGHNAMECGDQSKRPCWSSENTRPDNDSSDAHFEDAAAGAALLCAGACFHSNQGKYSTLYSGRDLAAAQAWVRGARSVPLEFQRGVYHHRNELEGPDCIRAYDRQLPDGRAFVVKIRP